MKQQSIVFGLALLFSTSSVLAIKGEELAADAKITLAKARSIALKVRAGKIVDEEIEREPGGSGLRYSFDIKAAGLTYEVGVDAKTGEVLENKPEGANPD
jgi:uncharacterized membrane protein YkoI